MRNYGLDLQREQAEQDGTEWRFGSTGLSCMAEVPMELRDLYLPKGEVQRTRYADLQDCASRAPINALELKFNYLLAIKKLSFENEIWIKENGYVTPTGVQFSDAFIAILS